ncbi:MULTISPECIES: YpzG family protein [unclassified Bacillus (in: firmicutes)]|uniref:YpzG family protein n=1 Tax=Bacillus TaxID=1386 RepID=UPI00338F9D5C
MSANGKSYMEDFVQLRTTAYPQPWANAKHSASQVNGETQQTQHDIVLQNNVRKQRSK